MVFFLSLLKNIVIIPKPLQFCISEPIRMKWLSLYFNNTMYFRVKTDNKEEKGGKMELVKVNAVMSKLTIRLNRLCIHLNLYVFFLG